MQRREADALDSVAFYAVERFNLTAQQRIIVGQASNACLRSLACMCSLACRVRVSLHVFLLECCYMFYMCLYRPKYCHGTCTKQLPVQEQHRASNALVFPLQAGGPNQPKECA
jgi:hypothetical protein